jgi:PAS domain S-box-containing protein
VSDSLVKVLIVDDSPEDRATLRRYLERTTPRQFAVIDANTGEEAFEMCREHCPDAILLDYNLPDIGGIEWLIEFMEGEGKFSCPVIMITGQGDETVAAQSILEGAQDYLVKGKITPVSLVHVIEGALKNYRLQREVSLLQTVVTHTSEPIVITEAEPIDMPGPRIIYVNQAFTQMTGYTAEEVIGQTPRILQGKNTCQQGRDTIRRALEAWEPVRVEMLNYRKDGTGDCAGRQRCWMVHTLGFRPEGYHRAKASAGGT